MFFKKYFLMSEATDGGTGGGGSGEGSGDSTPKDDGKGGQGSGSNDQSALPEWAQKELKELRGEAAKYRTQNKTLAERLEKLEKGLKGVFGEEEDDTDPGEKVKVLSQVTQTLEVKNAMLQLALENGIGSDDYEFFEFKMGKALESLEEGQEMTEDELAEIISGIKSKSGKGVANSTTKDGVKPPAAKDGEVTQEEFNRMSITAKSKLYQTNPALYDKLMKNAKL
jgi:hypothetical protein